MLSLIEQIKSGRLWDFPGGVHPPENKHQSNQTPPAAATLPEELVLPLKQHIGKPGDLLVSVGDTVSKGQPLTQSMSVFHLPVHAPTSGTVTAIEPRTTAHPSGLPELAVVIQPDGQETWYQHSAYPDYHLHAPEVLIDMIRQAGISGMGGAGFPTAKKILSGLARTEILIINAAECEPYITADDVLMQHYAQEIVQGIAILAHILSPKLIIIGIEDNKPEAIRALETAATGKDLVIRVIPTKYPSGGEKQLIKILTNLEVPADKLPADIGLMVQNIGTVYAIQRAIIHGEPLIQRVVTLTGATFEQPRNVWALIGTPIRHLLETHHYHPDKHLPRLIMGGPMMGFTLPHADVPLTKTTNCLLAPTRREISPTQQEIACIRCGQCADVCPASLLPQQLQWHAKAEEYDKCETLNLKDCIECGACAYVCPSEIPLVQYYRQAKAEIRTRKQEAEAAERARIRFEEKKARMEREKQERENRFKKAADNRRQAMVKENGGQDAVAAAIERVKSKNTQAKSEAKPAVAAAIARAKAKQEAALQSGADEPDNREMMKLREERKRQARARKAEKDAELTPETSVTAAQDKDSGGAQKAAVAAAIARAKARKAQQQAQSTPDETSSTVTDSKPEAVETAQDPKKAAVAAAVARAKARKAQQQAQSTPDETPSDAADSKPEAVETAQNAKKAAVAAAVARAKARKARQQAQSTPDETPSDAADSKPEAVETAQNPKKAAVAAAVARAKARKAQQQAQPTPDETPSDATDSAPEAIETAQDPKKAAVAAAVARAKARKAQQQAQSSSASDTEEKE
ncbi:electron transport complex subunit RsxC [Vibrio gazogenes]|uniref:Ion-translocating oxidoreductase complex subunit C n=1 Tax=Vibrio gazogenes DSM 21264 = NBRC 103151 TaxID=1123492 RepID=A0A1M5GFJ4_VIBGA|nr:electron transport complex subunit RsxC [Vibrio gazogenes]USP14631.1 electron transport complex subunit RsxC [Vibrio gazogenes]SHG02281.1 electron transport complex protein RnfC [Vibrio gazogenes DSM 21264] [Vibrio gazogenes DSM 21264 = NBRC 103151]SJN56053.1 Electron transport complex protein RnfC [Vibrio gazogenes]